MYHCQFSKAHFYTFQQPEAITLLTATLKQEETERCQRWQIMRRGDELGISLHFNFSYLKNMCFENVMSQFNSLLSI